MSRVETLRIVKVNNDETWRERIGNVLHALAAMVDRRTVLAIEIQTVPPISAETKREIILKGIDHMISLASEAVKAEGNEALLRLRHPELFE